MPYKHPIPDAPIAPSMLPRVAAANLTSQDVLILTKPGNNPGEKNKGLEQRSMTMEQIITTILTTLPASTIPIVVCVLGCCFIYLKIGKDRKQTKTERDNQTDELDKRLTLVEHDVEFMKEQNALFGQKLDRILEELTAIKVELAKKMDVK